MGGERVESRKLMIQPRPGKTDPEHQRRVDPRQRLVEIGALLLGDAVASRGRDLGQDLCRGGIKIADDRSQFHPRRHAHRNPAVCRHAGRGQRQRRFNVPCKDLSAAEQRDWPLLPYDML